MRSDDLYLVDIIEAGEAIARMVSNVPVERFVADEVLVSAVEMKLVIIAEALGSLSDQSRSSMLEVPVREVRGLRNRIVHGYFSVDESMIYEVAVGDVPPLVSQAERSLQRSFPVTFARLEERRAQRDG
ncbi:MAG: DUF86 domain-containing protein [Chthonomonadales bacterium]|nr:DUF86 domain-containing protein [Chthonomonadales bacterium]